MREFLSLLDSTDRKDKADEYRVHLFIVALFNEIDDPLELTVEEFRRLMVKPSTPPDWDNTYWGSAVYE